MAINPGVFPKLPVNPTKDFIAVTQVVDVPGVLVAHPSFPPNTVKELIAYAKANPGKLNYASPGSGSQNRLEMEVLRKADGPGHGAHPLQGRRRSGGDRPDRGRDAPDVHHRVLGDRPRQGRAG